MIGLQGPRPVSVLKTSDGDRKIKEEEARKLSGNGAGDLHGFERTKAEKEIDIQKRKRN
uniref:Uncharacterized protein n=1 Tax=Cucumis melo TaxID=3656 RepID=A0A9I9CET9_CUCME